MKTKQRLSGADRRVQLMDVARAVFARHGYDATSIEEIAREAGVTKPVVYEHFGSKEGIHAAVVTREMDLLVTLVSAGIAQGTPRQLFEAAVLAYLTYVDENPDGFAVLTRDGSTAHARRGMTRVIDDLADRIGDVFAAQFKHLGYSVKVAPIYTNALIGMVTQVGQWWAVEARGLPIEQVAGHVAALGWMGLRHLPKIPRTPAKKSTPTAPATTTTMPTRPKKGFAAQRATNAPAAPSSKAFAAQRVTNAPAAPSSKGSMKGPRAG